MRFTHGMAVLGFGALVAIAGCKNNQDTPAGTTQTTSGNVDAARDMPGSTVEQSQGGTGLDRSSDTALGTAPRADGGSFGATEPSTGTEANGGATAGEGNRANRGDAGAWPGAATGGRTVHGSTRVGSPAPGTGGSTGGPGTSGPPR